MLHRNTNKIIVILVYTLLEWVLISLLLLNSLFGYLITKYADFFGLKQPCIWCSRVDRLLQSRENVNSIKDSVCDDHAAEISQLSYCGNHGRLASSQDMCESCLPSGVTQRIAFYSLASEEKWLSEGKERVLSCSCCSESLSCKNYPSYLLFKPSSWCTLDYTKQGDIVIEEMDGGGSGEKYEESKKADNEIEDHADFEHQILSDVDSFSLREASEEECLKCLANFQWSQKEGSDIVLQSSSTNDFPVSKCSAEDDSVEFIDLEYMREHDDCHRFIPIDLIDSSTIELEQEKFPKTEDVNMDHDDTDEATMKELDEPPLANEDATHLEKLNGISTCEAGANEPDCSPEQSQFQEELAFANRDVTEVLDVPEETENTAREEAEAEGNTSMKEMNDVSLVNSEPEAEDDKFPDTPTSLESLHSLHKKLLLSDKRESSMEESLDGSVLSEIDVGDGVLTVERLKSALTAERKALRALYTELEEERSASAIAANQTMAMITRLQEEKAAMQMEALQYQRMMEEQAEYDQEALQLLNELMVKREKEKEELEKELEMYRHKIVDYEAEDDVDESDDDGRLSIDLNREMVESSHDYNSPADDEVQDLEEMALDCMKHMNELDDSLAEFEEERLSILDQLKALEEKLLVMSAGEEGQGPVDNAEPSEEHMETMQSMAKRLLPLLDEAEDETQEEQVNFVTDHEQMEHNPEPLEIKNIEEPPKVDVVEEVDRVYERLQALEEDGEFLKHCMKSVKKGDEGMDLLHEILQHLRDLKSVELRVQSIDNE